MNPVSSVQPNLQTIESTNSVWSTTNVNPASNVFPTTPSESANQSGKNVNSVYSSSQNNMGSNNMNDEDLLKSFIGNNYKKLTTRTFNFAGFFLFYILHVLS